MTDGYSGSDLKHLCSAAAMYPIRELLKSTSRDADDDALLTREQLRPLDLDDFARAKSHVRASTSNTMESLRELRKWHRTFAQGTRDGGSTGADVMGF